MQTLKYKTIVIVDGGYYRKIVTSSKGMRIDKYVDFVVKNIYSTLCDAEETLLRILYYDCRPFKGKAKRPVSGEIEEFEKANPLFDKLAQKQQFALRLGDLRFRGYKPKKIPVNAHQISDEDFEPIFEQKGVDMRIGLDIAHYSSKLLVERIILITNDTDIIPAIKEARRNGVQIITIKYADSPIHRDIIAHSDFVRKIAIEKPSQ